MLYWCWLCCVGCVGVGVGCVGLVVLGWVGLCWVGCVGLVGLGWVI